jgi:hypothetical protein
MKKVLTKILLIVIGTAFVLYGVVIPLLPVVGEKASGKITVIRREGGERNETTPNRYSYSVGYEFALEDGTVICGNTKVIGNATSAGIATTHTNVFYLNIFPYINARESDTAFTIGNVILVSVGVLLIAVALRIGTKAKPHGKKCKGGV